MWNIFLPANHPINLGRTPIGFKPAHRRTFELINQPNSLPPRSVIRVWEKWWVSSSDLL
jgi:hypothetical protein